MKLDVYYRSHIQNNGWEEVWRKNGQTSGTVGKSLRLEAFQIKLDTDLDLRIVHKEHIENIGWDEINNNEIAGTEGLGLRMEAFNLKLEGTDANKYKIIYTTQIENIGWLNWTGNGENTGTEGFGLRMEAIKVMVVENEVELNVQTTETFRQKIDINKSTETDYNNEFPMQGIDVSQWQDSINWNSVKNNTDKKFAFPRLGWGEVNNSIGGELDSFAITNINNCIQNNLNLGTYLYSYAQNENEAKLEANFVKSTLLQFPQELFKFGIWLDLEDEKYQGNIDINPIIDAFCTEITNAGYNAGYYCSLSWYQNKVNDEIKAKWDFWLAQYNDSPSVTSKIWQYTSTGSVDGINGNVDLNICYKNYLNETNPVSNTPIIISPSNNQTPQAESLVYNTYELQRVLKILNYGSNLDCDGIYGPKTQEAIINAQNAYGITADGISGTITENHLIDQLKCIQTKLTELGYPCAINGRMDTDDTINQLLSFQKNYNLDQDWIVGTKTYSALFSSTPSNVIENPEIPSPIIPNVDGQITVNFNLSEFACDCGGRFCNGSTELMDLELIRKLQRVRDKLGQPLVVTSGVRCPQRNAEVGGVPDSVHLEGKAADIYTPGMNEDMVNRLRDLCQEEGLGTIRYFDMLFVHTQMYPRND